MTAGSFSVARINTAILVAWAAAGSNSSSASMLNWRGCGAGAEHIDKETCSSITHILQLRRVKGIAARRHMLGVLRGVTHGIVEARGVGGAVILPGRRQ